MDLYYIDYLSVHGRNWLHNLPVWLKMLSLVVVIGTLLSVPLLSVQAAIAGIMLIVALSARLPMSVFLPLALSPVMFLALIFVSTGGLTFQAALVLALRVLAITSSVVAFLLSTSYPAIFGTLSRVLPGFLVAALFFTYRSIFVIADSIANIRIAFHLRGGIDRKHPIKTVRRFGMALGHFIVHSIDASQRMADSLRVRGFRNRIYYLGGGR